MKRLVLLFLWMSLSLPLVGAQGPEKDFGLRLDLGQLYGLGSKANHLIGLTTDAYFLSEKIRMIFGVNYVIPKDKALPVSGLQFLGTEYAFKAFKQHLFVGLRYNKTYIKTKSRGLDSSKGFEYYLGHKLALSPMVDFFSQFGVIKQPYKVDADKVSAKDQLRYIRFGLEYYF